jgi:hypothetical protein
MPLIKPRKGSSKKQKRKVASQNISIERRAGRPLKQAIAIGLSSVGLGKKKKPNKRLGRKAR